MLDAPFWVHLLNVGGVYLVLTVFVWKRQERYLSIADVQNICIFAITWASGFWLLRLIRDLRRRD
jgi:hypothetical protein